MDDDDGRMCKFGASKKDSCIVTFVQSFFGFGSVRFTNWKIIFPCTRDWQSRKIRDSTSDAFCRYETSKSTWNEHVSVCASYFDSDCRKRLMPSWHVNENDNSSFVLHCGYFIRISCDSYSFCSYFACIFDEKRRNQVSLSLSSTLEN